MTRKPARKAKTRAKPPRNRRQAGRNRSQTGSKPARSAVRAEAKRPAATWKDLVAELDQWRAAGRFATFWWRDDDVELPSPRLDRLIAISKAAPNGPIPLTLAVIPARTGMALWERLEGEEHVRLFQHGWSHANHAPEGERTMELGAHRPTRIVMEELDRGRDDMELVGNGYFFPVIVPPWNRIDPKIVRQLDSWGFWGLSTFGPRPWPDRRRPENRPIIVNVHIDIFQWRPKARFIGTGAALGQAVAHLAARRLGIVDPDEHTGLMTHHLQHDAGCWRFIERFLAVTASHPAGRWISSADMLLGPFEPPLQSVEWTGPLVPE